MQLYVVRHGETELNKKKVLQGNTDSPLTQKGLEDAKKVAKGFEHIHFDFVITSNLGRAIHTAEILVNGKGNQIIRDANVSEMCFGNWQGKTQKEICVDEQTTQNYYAYFQRPEQYRPENGAESFEELILRASNFLIKMKQLASSNPNAKVLLVSHGAFIKAMIHSINNHSLENFWNEPFIPNLSVTILEVSKDRVEIVKESDQSFVGGEFVRIEDSGYLK